jgi:hypothetical protein
MTSRRTDKRGHPRLLLVEGADDQRRLPWVIELGCGLEWERAGRPLVFIEKKDGAEALLQRGTIAAELFGSGREVLGVVIDADDDPGRRWQSIRDRLLADLTGLGADGLPLLPPREGFIAELDQDAPTGPRRLGVWMMPDNRSLGMLETFVRSLVSEDGLHGLAERSCDEATRLGARFKPTHRDKAIVHTWLAWQDPPGRQLHDAVRQRMLDPSLPPARAFIGWFRRLFGT